MKIFARKIIHPVGRREIIAKEISNEARVIEKIREGGGHDNVIAVLSHGWLIKDQFYFIDMDLLGFSLRDFIGYNFKSAVGSRFFDRRSSQDDGLASLSLWCIVEHMARGLEFIHGKRELHRDIKPENGRPLKFRLRSETD